MSICLEHDYSALYCKVCDGYMGMACTVCGDMTDGGEHTYYTQEWCKCADGGHARFDGEEDDPAE